MIQSMTNFNLWIYWCVDRRMGRRKEEGRSNGKLFKWFNWNIYRYRSEGRKPKHSHNQRSIRSTNSKNKNKLALRWIIPIVGSNAHQCHWCWCHSDAQYLLFVFLLIWKVKSLRFLLASFECPMHSLFPELEKSLFHLLPACHLYKTIFYLTSTFLASSFQFRNRNFFF